MKRLIAVFLAWAVVMMTGCPTPTTPPPSTAGGGFFISTFTSFNLSPPVIAPLTQIQLSWKKDLPGAVGDSQTQIITTNSTGLGIVPNGRAPATWHFKWLFSLTGPCEGQELDANAKEIDDDVGLLCTVTDFPSGAQTATASGMPDYQFSPNPIATDRSTGDEAFILGSGFNKQFGMPLIQYFDLSGNLVAQTNADAIAADGTWMSAPVPDISQLSVGTYVGFLNNANSSGGYDILGAVSLQVALPPPPPPPPDPCPGGRCINQCYDRDLKPWLLVAALLFSVQP
jgi:hypothetical protein